MIYLKGEFCDFIVLDPGWLCHAVCGQLLSREFIFRSRPTGCYSLPDFEMAMPQWDAVDLLPVLESLGICTQVRLLINIFRK